MTTKKKNKPNFNCPAGRSCTLCALTCFVLLYMYYEIVVGYLAGGEEAPDMLLMVVGFIVLVGGAVWSGVQAVKQYKACCVVQPEQNDARAETAPEAIDKAEEIKED